MIGPIDGDHVAHGLAPPVMFILGSALALFLTMFVPPSASRLVACVLALIGIGVLSGAAGPQTPFQLGLAVGLMLASAKLATGVRFL